MNTNEIENRLREAEKKIHYLDKVIWAAAAVLVTFGASGAFGIKLLNSASKKIDSLNRQVLELEKKVQNQAELQSKIETTFNDTSRKYLTDFKTNIQKISKDEAKKFSLDTIKVSSISIVDENGNEGISLTTTTSGGKISIYDNKGSIRISLRSDSESAGWLRIYDNKNKKTHDLGSYSNSDNPFVLLSKGKDNILLRLDGNNDGGNISLYEENGKKSMFLGSQDDGDGFIRVKSLNNEKDKIVTP